MALLHYKVNERYRYYQFQQNQSGHRRRDIMIIMLELMIHEIQDHPNMHRDILETFRDMTYCRIMRLLYTPDEWIRFKSEVDYLIQFLEPSPHF